MKKTVSIIIAVTVLASLLGIAAFAEKQNPWSGSDIARIDTNNSSDVIGYRFEPAPGSTGSLIGVNAHVAGSAATFDFKIYVWQGNHTDTLKTAPIFEKTGITHTNNDTWWYDGHTIDIPAGKVVKGSQYYMVITNVSLTDDGDKWAFCNYISSIGSENAGFRAYLNGEPYMKDGKYTSLMWQFVWEDGSWAKNDPLSDDTAPSQGGSSEETTHSVHTWGEGWDMSSKRYDGAGAAQFAYRFATKGTGRLVSIIPYMAGSAGKFDCIVYKWNGDYEHTVSGKPAAEIRNIAFNGQWTNWTDKIQMPGSGLPAGEYLVVLTNFNDIEWAICNYRMPEKAGFKTYLNGEAETYDDGKFYTLAWQLEFTGDGNVVLAALSADEAPSSTDTFDMTCALALVAIASVGGSIAFSKKKRS
ncbi:MAG: hypothetical protein IKX86_01540 [Clostridia bacterium]|nr:hypothetical protein [Clostridia bacterium]